MKIRNKLYNGETEVMFESFRHQYFDKNGEIPSVTTILSIIGKPALISWAANTAIDYVSQQIEPGKSYDELELQAVWEGGKRAHYQKKTDAGTVGMFLHKFIEQYIKGENPAAPVNEGLRDSVGLFLAWVEKHQVKFLLSEQMVMSRKYHFVGTLDFVCTIDGKMYLGDLKTSSGIYPEMFLQTAAYRLARTEEYPEEDYAGQLIIRIGKEGDFEVAIVRDDVAYRSMLVGFIAALKLYETMKSLKKYTPKKE